MSTQALLIEFLVISILRNRLLSRSVRVANTHGFAPAKLFVLTDRLERLRRTRWQWSAMVLLLVLVRLQLGAPLVAELTGLTQFVVFLALPSQSTSAGVLHRP